MSMCYYLYEKLYLYIVIYFSLVFMSVYLYMCVYIYSTTRHGYIFELFRLLEIDFLVICIWRVSLIHETHSFGLKVEDIVSKFEKLHKKFEVIPTVTSWDKLIKLSCNLSKVYFCYSCKVFFSFVFVWMGMLINWKTFNLLIMIFIFVWCAFYIFLLNIIII